MLFRAVIGYRLTSFFYTFYGIESFDRKGVNRFLYRARYSDNPNIFSSFPSAEPIGKLGYGKILYSSFVYFQSIKWKCGRIVFCVRDCNLKFRLRMENNYMKNSNIKFGIIIRFIIFYIFTWCFRLRDRKFGILIVI